MPLRTLHFGQQDEGLVTFLGYPPDDLVLVVRIQWGVRRLNGGTSVPVMALTLCQASGIMSRRISNSR